MKPISYIKILFFFGRLRIIIKILIFKKEMLFMSMYFNAIKTHNTLFNVTEIGFQIKNLIRNDI